MAYLPRLARRSAKQLITGEFGGLNRAPAIGDGEWSAMQNLSARAYPLLCPRLPRGMVQALTKPQGILGRDKLCVIDNGTIYYDGTAVEGVTLSTADADMPKRLVSMGAYVCIWPDKKYFNTVDLSDCGSMEGAYESQGSVILTPCRLDGSDFGNVTVSASAPEDPQNGEYWIDASEDTHQLRMWSDTAGAWTAVLTVYTRIQASGIGAAFSKGDVVELSGIAAGTEAGAALKKQLEALNGARYVYGVDSDYLTVEGLLDAAYEQESGQVTCRRSVPEMEYVVECGNRLWGCHYGLGTDGKIVNEIYACRLGDFKNWRVYQGTSMDAYALSVGSDGPWTGAITYGGMPTFFKENVLHKIYGSQPSNYQSMDTQLRGVKRGCAGSLQCVDGALIYRSPAGIEMYDGSMPVAIGAPLGEELGAGAEAGVLGRRYYVSLQDAKGQWALYCYDTAAGLWHREDATHALMLAAHAGELYYVDADSRRLMTACGGAGEQEKAVRWWCESGMQTYEYVSHKYVTRYNIRAQLSQGARLRVYIRYNGRGVWQMKANITSDAAGTRTLLVPVYPRRCDHMQLRLEGEGEIKVFSIARLLTNGGDGQHG